MKWKGKRQSSNVDDRRGQRSAPRGIGKVNPLMLGQLMKLLFSRAGLVIVGILLIVSFLFGKNPLTFIGQLLLGNGVQTESASYRETPKTKEMAEFSATILASTEDVWNQLLRGYREPTMVLFTDRVASACGAASSATGPFYCPGDEKLYLDLSFFDDMERQLNAPGDFAQAYVIAHEVGHHVQNLLGITGEMDRMRRQLSKTEYNKYSVRLELQADYFAGVWAHHSERMTRMMEAGDLEEALNAAHAIGDDRLQKQATGHVVPDSFTHGTSEQRMRWFKKGFESGDPNKGDTFNANPL